MELYCKGFFRKKEEAKQKQGEANWALGLIKYWCLPKQERWKLPNSSLAETAASQARWCHTYSLLKTKSMESPCRPCLKD